MRKEIRERLNQMGDAEYREFSASLIPVSRIPDPEVKAYLKERFGQK